MSENVEREQPKVVTVTISAAGDNSPKLQFRGCTVTFDKSEGIVYIIMPRTIDNLSMLLYKGLLFSSDGDYYQIKVSWVNLVSIE